MSSKRPKLQIAVPSSTEDVRLAELEKAVRLKRMGSETATAASALSSDDSAGSAPVVPTGDPSSDSAAVPHEAGDSARTETETTSRPLRSDRERARSRTRPEATQPKSKGTGTLRSDEAGERLGTIAIPSDLAERLRLYAARARRSKADVVTASLRDYLDRVDPK